MKEKVNYGTVFVFIVLLIAFFYIGVLAPKDEEALKRENRELTPMPTFSKETVLSGSFSKDFEDYLADNVGFRSHFMDASATISAFKGVTTESGKVVSTKKDLGVGTAGEGSLWIQGGRIMEVYKADNATRDAHFQLACTDAD